MYRAGYVVRMETASTAAAKTKTWDVYKLRLGRPPVMVSDRSVTEATARRRAAKLTTETGVPHEAAQASTAAGASTVVPPLDDALRRRVLAEGRTL